MGIRTLFGQVDPEKLKALPVRTRSPERVEQSINAFAMHLQGISYRGIQEQFGWKSPNTAVNAVRRGEELAKTLNLDNERIKLKLAAYFDEILDITMQQVKEQVKAGRVTVDVDAEGNQSMRCAKGVDPRLLGEAGRSAIRFAQFAGLMDADKSTTGGGDISTNVVFISPQADLSEWETRTVDVTPSESKSESNGDLMPANTYASIHGPTAVEAVKAAEEPAGQGSAQIVQRGLC